MDAERLLYREFRPHPALAPFVRVVWELQARDSGPPEGRVEPIYPDGCVEWIVHLADPCQALDARGTLRVQAAQLIAGPGSRAMQLARGSDTLTLGVRLEPGAARALGLPPLAELRDQVVDVAALSLPALRQAAADIATAPQHERRRRLESVLLQSFHGHRPPPALALARALRDGARVEALARQSGLSRRTLEREFASEVGLSPRSLRGVERFRRALAALAEAPHASLAAVAQAVGYADQAHFCRDFRRHAGTTPSESRRAAAPFTRAFATAGHADES